MDIVEVISQRRSIRAFKPNPVPQKVLKEIVELALRAPSWANTQPWEFAIVGGKKLEEVREGFMARSSDIPNPDVPIPKEFPEPFNTRRRAVGASVFEIKGIGREDKEKRVAWTLAGLRLFEAPNAIYILTDRSFYLQAGSVNVWPIFDCGCVAENIMLLATKHGLGTIAQIAAVMYPDVLRKVLEIPDSKVIVLGIAIGYPDWDESINQLHTDRVPLDEVARWHGF
ncbi:MAG: nitroreductase [Chloroflexi bacterium]|nr:nitroreductase [Chloroflexota bacterium]